MHIFIKLLPLLSLCILSLNAQEYENKKPIDLSMVISGGVSLGAYEAGYNWAMVKMLSKIRDNSQKVTPKLRSVTGASAGSINALLTAIYWCQKPEIDELNSIENNLFYNTWVDLGLSDLIITDPKSDNKSTLFTRDKLKIKSKAILELMQRPNFQEGCEVPLGFSVTKARPMITEFQKSGIKIKNQHFSIPLTLKEKNNQLMLENRAMPKSTDYYIAIPEIEKDNEKVIDVLFASSAFPGAFKQIKLNYIYEGKAQSSYFIDGGAYDNLPLQLATELDKEAKDFIFIDPSNIRKAKEQNSTKEEEQEPVGFLASNALPLLDSLDIFQSMRLYSAITQYFGEASGKKLILSSRYHPITGKFLGHFGAFLDKDFRIYDYHVGVYDAIYHLSKAMKERDPSLKVPLEKLMMFQKRALGINKNSKANRAFTLFFNTEFFPNQPIIVKDKFSTIYFAFNKNLGDTERYNLTEFQTFLSKLNPQYLTDDGSFIPRGGAAIRNWYKEPLQLLINRITVLENSYAEVEGNTKVLASATNMVAWLTNNFVKKKNGFDFLPMNIPDHASNPILANTLRLLPNELTTDVKNGGLGVGYNIYSYQEEHNRYGFESKVSFHQSDDIQNFIHLDMSIFQQRKDAIKFGVGGSLFGTFNSQFYDKESLYGVNAYVDILDIFRLTYIHRYGEIDEKDFVYFGIENLPSLLYWLQR